MPAKKSINYFSLFKSQGSKSGEKVVTYRAEISILLIIPLINKLFDILCFFFIKKKLNINQILNK